IANPPRLADAVRERLVKQVSDILAYAKGIGCIRRTPRAAELWEELYRKLSTGRPGLVGTLLARGPAHVTRLSTLFALLDRTSEVDVEHLTAAAAWWDYNVQSVEIIFAGRTGSDAADRIKAEMLPGQSRTLSEIREELFSNHIGSGSLRDALDLLRKLGLVQLSERTGTGGRAAVVVTRLNPDSTTDRAAGSRPWAERRGKRKRGRAAAFARFSRFSAGAPAGGVRNEPSRPGTAVDLRAPRAADRRQRRRRPGPG